MKTLKEIEERIASLKAKLKSEIELYKNMSQIDAQSNYGNNSSNILSKTRGEIKALEWVLNISK